MSNRSAASASVIPVILNRASGTVKDLSAEALKELLLVEGAAAGLCLDIYLVQPGEVEGVFWKLVENKVPEIWVGGGDGSVLTAAALLRKSGIVLGVLPFGTFNLLARDLGISMDPAEAVRSLAKASVEAIDVAEVNGHPFLCAAQLGFFPALASRQEEFHGRQWWRKLLIGATALVKSYFRFPELALQLEHKDGKPQKWKTRSLTVSNNVYAESIGLVPARDSLEDGKMGIYVSRHHSWFSLLKGALWTLMGRQREDEGMLFFELAEFTLKSRRPRHVPATLDGEKLELRTPLHFKIHSHSLKVRKPNPRAKPTQERVESFS